jgi:hypothetical protein
MTWDDNSYGESELSLGRSLVPLDITLDRNLVAQAQAHLREQSPLQRVRWHRQIEVVLHRFARSHDYRRQPVHVGAGRTQIWWIPPKGSGLPLTDIQFLRDPTLHAFAGFQSLCKEISEHAGLAQLVQVSPEDDILPVRTKYDGETYTIGLNHLRAAEAFWYTLADCLVSKLLTGRCPRIERAVTYRPGPPQVGLISAKILERDDFRIDPTRDGGGLRKGSLHHRGVLDRQCGVSP